MGPYVALFAVMLLAWAGLPVAGQSALLAAGVLAGDGQLAIEWVLAAAAAGSAIGGAIGYWMGFHGGRLLRAERGPLSRWRRRELASGAQLVKRHVPIAVLLAPTWIAGINHVPWRDFLPWNLGAAAVWTVVTGLGGYWIGPAMSRALGVANAAFLAAGLVLLAFVASLLWRRHNTGRTADS